MKDMIQLTLSSNGLPVLINRNRIQCIYSDTNREGLDVTRIDFDDNGVYVLVKEKYFSVKNILKDECTEDATNSLMNLMKGIKMTCEERKICTGCVFYNVDIADCVFIECPERWYL